MRVIVDANRVVSALLRDGPTRRALVEARSELRAPDVMREEVLRHAPAIAARAGLSPEAAKSAVEILLTRIEQVDRATYSTFLGIAHAALGHRDPDDVPYLAAALAIRADAIWSEDRDFDAQTLVPRTRHPDRIER